MPEKSLHERLFSRSNLKAAWYELNKANPHSCGLSEETIEDFAKGLPSNLNSIRLDLKNNRYKFAPVLPVVIKKRKSSDDIKLRGIKIQEIRDRIVQRGIARLIEPILDREFDLHNEASFAYLKKRSKDDGRRSVREAVARMLILFGQGKRVIFEADIEKFFNTVDQKHLLEKMVFPHLPDPSINELIRSALQQEIYDLNSLTDEIQSLFPKPTDGIPQGGALSPLFANIYLSDFDRRMIQKSFGLVRYADDFVVMCSSEAEAMEAHKLAKEILEDQLHLKLHDEKTRIIKCTQKNFNFLAIAFNGARIWPSSDSFSKLKQNIRHWTKYSADKKLPNVLIKIKNIIEGWIAAYSFTDLEPFLGHIETEIRKRIGVGAHWMGWLPNTCLTDRQFRFSGIPDLSESLKQKRSSLLPKEKDFFHRFWSVSKRVGVGTGSKSAGFKNNSTI